MEDEVSDMTAESDSLHCHQVKARRVALGDGNIPKNLRVATALVGVAFVLTAAQAPLLGDEKSSVQEIRKELLQLPYYGVFDFLAFRYEKGTVSLMGYAYHSTLKPDAVRAAKRASRVDQVIDSIEELPVSQFDDDVRRKTYYAIYRDRSSHGTRRVAASSGVIGTRSGAISMA
jgi:hypothetical protein